MGISGLVFGLGATDCKPEEWTEVDAMGPRNVSVASVPFAADFSVRSSVALHEVTVRVEPTESQLASLGQGTLSMSLTDMSATPPNTVSDVLEADGGAATNIAGFIRHFCDATPCLAAYHLEISWTGPLPIELSWKVNASETAGGDKPEGAAIRIELTDAGTE